MIYLDDYAKKIQKIKITPVRPKVDPARKDQDPDSPVKVAKFFRARATLEYTENGVTRRITVNEPKEPVKFTYVSPWHYIMCKLHRLIEPKERFDYWRFSSSRVRPAWEDLEKRMKQAFAASRRILRPKALKSRLANANKQRERCERKRRILCLRNKVIELAKKFPDVCTEELLIDALRTYQVAEVLTS